MSSVTGVNNTLINMQNATNQTKAQEEKTTGTTELGQDAFLSLMIEQLKCQDPLSPMENTEFLNQQAMFSQVSALQDIKSSISTNNAVMQASNLVGKTVAIQDPNNSENIITGEVTQANFYSGNATVVVGNKEYPLSYVMAAANPTTGTESGTGTDTAASAE